MDQCLPTTGTDVATLLIVAVAFVAAGAIAVCIARRNAALAVVLIAAGVLVWASGTATAAVDCPPPSVASTTTTPQHRRRRRRRPRRRWSRRRVRRRRRRRRPSRARRRRPRRCRQRPRRHRRRRPRRRRPSTTDDVDIDDDDNTEAPVPPQAVAQTVTAAEVIAGSLIDDGDFLGTPTATITSVNAVQGPGALPSESRPRSAISTGGRAARSPSRPTAATRSPRRCRGRAYVTIQYTLSNAGGSSTATEIFEVPAP